MIPYGHQDITQSDIKAVVDILQSDFLTQGPKVPLFEQLIATKVGAKNALAMNSATSALHVSCLALGLGVGDWLWTTPITFVASANCGLYCGARIDFVDIDHRTYNLCPDALEAKLIKAEQVGNLPKIVVAVHLCGQPCDMEHIYNLGQYYGFKIIEDASHAIGGKYRGEYIGNCRYSDVTVFSFHPVKIITTGEGGIAVTNNDEIYQYMNLLRSHGVTRDKKLMTHGSDEPWYYQQIALGYNYRMTDIQAALGISQMYRLDNYVSRRHALSDRYDQLLEDLPVVTPWQNNYSYSARHLYVIRIKLEKINLSHREVFERLRRSGVGVNLHYIPIYKQPYYQMMGYKDGECPQAESYYKESISLPLYPGLTNEDQDTVIRVLKEVLST